jgi:hypothetical protein
MPTCWILSAAKRNERRWFTATHSPTGAMDALAFRIFVVDFIVFGSMIIMSNLNHAMMPMDRLVQMLRAPRHLARCHS